MGCTRCVRLQWREMAWYGWTVFSALVVTGSVLAYLLGYDGIRALWGI